MSRFYSNLNIEDINDIDNAYAKDFVKNSTKKLEWDDDLYVQSDTLLLAEIFVS